MFSTNFALKKKWMKQRLVRKPFTVDVCKRYEQKRRLKFSSYFLSGTEMLPVLTFRLYIWYLLDGIHCVFDRQSADNSHGAKSMSYLPQISSF